MNVAQERPRSWTPHIILFSIVLHAVLLYYIAIAFQIVPLPTPPTFEPKTIQTIRLDPKPPELPPEPIKMKRPVTQRIPNNPRVDPIVPPSPIPVSTTPGPQDPVGTDVRGEIGEQPVAQALPNYPRYALEKGVEGRVIMTITIMPDGTVRDVKVVSARPQGYFEAAAVRAVQTWRYRPSNLIRYNVMVHMDFQLRDA
jgi:periplasmic protein TonB